MVGRSGGRNQCDSLKQRTLHDESHYFISIILGIINFESLDAGYGITRFLLISTFSGVTEVKETKPDGPNNLEKKDSPNLRRSTD